MNEFDSVASYYDEVIEKGYHNQKSYLSALLKILHKGDSVLELGCGTGNILLELTKHGILTKGIDASSEMIARLRTKNKHVVTYISDLNSFHFRQEYDYALSCNGPFSIKGKELESYILEKRKVTNILRKYSKNTKKGLLINKGIEKPKLKIPLSNNRLFVHRELRIENIMVMVNLIFKNDRLEGSKIFLKRRYPIKTIFKGLKSKDLGNFKLILP